MRYNVEFFFLSYYSGIFGGARNVIRILHIENRLLSQYIRKLCGLKNGVDHLKPLKHLSYATFLMLEQTVDDFN